MVADNYYSTYNFTLFIGFIFFLYLVIYYFKQFKQYRAQKKKYDERIIPECPDYWTNIGKHKCRNDKNIGICGPTVDFNDEVFNPPNNPEAKNYTRCRWAKTCKAPWEYISTLC